MVTYLTRERDAINFARAVAFEEGGAGDEGGAGRRDIIDEPNAFSLEEICRSIRGDCEGSGEIFFSGLFVFLSRLGEGEVGANERVCLQYEMETRRDGIGEALREELCLIETTPLLAPAVERNRKDDVGEWEGCAPQ